jgi:hypothetical protein
MTFTVRFQLTVRKTKFVNYKYLRVKVCLVGYTYSEVTGCFENGNEISGSKKCGQFDWLTKHLASEKDSASAIS